MYELLILSLLMRIPTAHGYLIAKIINDTIGPYAKLSNGRLYPLLAELEENGLIAFVTSEDEEQLINGRCVRTYKITEAGHKRFRHLMLDTSSNPGEYQKVFVIKAAALEFLSLHERLRLLNHYLNYCQTHILHLTSEVEDLIDRTNSGEITPRDAVIEMMRHRIEQWQLELDWANRLLEREMAAQPAQIL